MSTDHPSAHPAALGELAERVLALAPREPGGRVLLGIAGSPGAGKTTLALALVEELNRRTGGAAVHLPMDGYHLANSTLDRLGLRDRKGAIETFDGWGFRALLDRVRAETGHTVYAPSFHRRVDEGVAGEIAIAPAARIVVVEGNYLLVDAEPWDGILDRLDEAWYAVTDGEERERRLVDRHTRHGRSEEAATAWAREVDGANAVGIEASRERAALLVSGATWRPLAP
ncbi:nucleoside/nucleotide kinase family protein [Homoserinibacter sp. YIM 151385]|uniref:nucleoside/nucleotide kinase family protein n=1 Tax=Homoserinibacter sp. YIM 151385 TaxID=2985506 RepID=UPI0022F036B5|nr:nucleoside/nucleotide kinase family protein [Homoserinibacter sp. YIM 151385]WBU38018.1 nucleoside/nucleotide kinase family protein [Homoserinibacter sp. YIM 151385]